MKIEHKYNRLFGITVLSDIFFTDYLPELDGDGARLYLMLTYHCKMGEKTTPDKLAGELGMSAAAVNEKLVLLEQKGLVVRIDDRIVLQDINQRELEICYKSRTAGALDDEFADRGETREKRSEIVKAISDKTFGGNMAPDWYQDISFFFSKYGFEPEVMLLLFQHCKKHNGLTKPYVRRVAEEWNRSGIRTLEQAVSYMETYENYRQGRGLVAKKLRLSLPMDEYSEEIVKKWFTKFGYGTDIVELALQRAPNKRNAGIKYFDAILSSWYEKGVKKPEDVAAAEAAHAAEAAESSKAAGVSQKKNYDTRKYDEAFLEGLYKDPEEQ